MRLRVYEDLYRINWHLAEAAHSLKRLAESLQLDRTAIALTLNGIEEARRDANCVLSNEINDRALAQSRKRGNKNWRLHEMLGTKRL